MTPFLCLWTFWTALLWAISLLQARHSLPSLKNNGQGVSVTPKQEVRWLKLDLGLYGQCFKNHHCVKTICNQHIHNSLYFPIVWRPGHTILCFYKSVSCFQVTLCCADSVSIHVDLNSHLPSELIPRGFYIDTMTLLVCFLCRLCVKFWVSFCFFSGIFTHGVISTLMIKRPEISKICRSGHYSCFKQDGFDVWSCPVFFKRQLHLCLKKTMCTSTRFVLFYQVIQVASLSDQTLEVTAEEIQRLEGNKNWGCQKLADWPVVKVLTLYMYWCVYRELGHWYSCLQSVTHREILSCALIILIYLKKTFSDTISMF